MIHHTRSTVALHCIICARESPEVDAAPGSTLRVLDEARRRGWYARRNRIEDTWRYIAMCPTCRAEVAAGVDLGDVGGAVLPAGAEQQHAGNAVPGKPVNLTDAAARNGDVHPRQARGGRLDEYRAKGKAEAGSSPVRVPAPRQPIGNGDIAGSENAADGAMPRGGRATDDASKTPLTTAAAGPARVHPFLPPVPWHMEASDRREASANAPTESRAAPGAQASRCPGCGLATTCTTVRGIRIYACSVCCRTPDKFTLFSADAETVLRAQSRHAHTRPQREADAERSGVQAIGRAGAG